MVRDRQEVARYLVTRGCRTDILMAAALGDLDLVRRPPRRRSRDAPHERVDAFFPKQNPRSGGTIYPWTLGADKTAHAVAREFGHREVLAELVARSPPELRIVVAAAAGDEAAVRQFGREPPGLFSSLSNDERAVLADAARDNDMPAVRRCSRPAGRLMPAASIARHPSTGPPGTAIGRAPGARRERTPHHVKGDQYDGRLPSWAVYGSVNGWKCGTGDYAGTVETLIAAGAQVLKLTPELNASDAVRAVLARHAG